MTSEWTALQAEHEENCLNAEIMRFFKKWTPEDHHDAAQFNMELHSIVRRVYADMQTPVTAALEAVLRAAPPPTYIIQTGEKP